MHGVEQSDLSGERDDVLRDERAARTMCPVDVYSFGRARTSAFTLAFSTQFHRAKS